MKSKKIAKNIYSLKYNMTEFFAQNKYKIIVCLLFCFVGLLTGIFTAIKLYDLDDSDVFESFNLTYQLEDLEKFSQNFFGRLLSYEIVLAILLIFSLNPVLYIFGWCLLAYRSFLISINCVMLILFFSFNGIIKALLIILPCQLLMILILIGFFCYMIKHMRYNRCVNCKKFTLFFNAFLIATLLLSLINIVETFLLFIFRSNVILVI